MGTVNRRYNWKRFWCPREGQNTLDCEGYLLDPDGEHGWYAKPCAVAFDDIASRPCLLLLGEPGIGKSSAMARQREIAARQLPPGEELLDIDFRLDRDLKSDLFEHPKFKGWLEGKHTLHLFLDSLDECPEADAASRILGKLRRGPVEKLRLRIACRTAEVPLVLEQGLQELWSQDDGGKSFVGIYELAPLRKKDVELAARDDGLDAGAFLAEVAHRGAVALATKPVTLSFLLRRYRARGALPNTRWAIYKEGCQLLCEERSLTRRDRGETGRLDARQRMMVAARIAAVCLLGNRSMIHLGTDPGDLPEDALLAEVLRGRSERVGEQDFEVDARAVRETLTMTGLFTDRGRDQLLGWAHQTYAEFLAAYFLRERGLELEALEGILFPSVERVQIVPALREVAAWMASADAEIFTKLTHDDPRTLLRSDVAMVGDVERERLVGALLQSFADRELIDVDVGNKAVYRKLSHHRLPEQLEPWIRGRDRYFIARRGAIDIAEACEERRRLQDALADVALDPADDVNLRTRATRAVVTIADEAARLRLRPLAHGQAGKDPYDELKGYALTALWPGHMPASELFSCLTRPKNKGHFGAYRAFIERELEKGLSDADLVEALAWAERQPRTDHPIDRFAKLIGRLTRRAWDCMDDPAILEALVHLAHVKFGRHEHLFPEPIRHEAAGARTPDEHRKQQRFIETYLQLTKLPAQPDREYWTFVSQGMLHPDDLFWMLSRLEAAGEQALRRRWASLVNAAIQHQGFTYDSVSAVIDAAPRHPELHEALRWMLDPVQLDSPLAEQQKRSWQEAQQLGAELRLQRRERLLAPPPAERVLRCLERAEQGDLDAFWQMQRVMSLHPTSTHYSDHGQPSLTSFPGWRDADDPTRRRVLLVARRYIMERDAAPGQWLAHGSFYHPAIAGYRALLLLKDLDPTGFEALPASAWQRWTPAIIGYPISSSDQPTEEESHSELVRLAYRLAPEETLWTLAILIDKEIRIHDDIFIYRKLSHCWDDRLNALLLLKAQDLSLSPSPFGSLLGELLERGVEGAREYAASLLALPLPRRRGVRARARAAAQALFVHTADAGWPVLKQVFRAARGFGRKVVLGAVADMPRRQRSRWLHLSEDEVAELFLWMEEQFPRAKDRNLFTGELQAIEPRDEAAELRNALLNSLSERGTRAALDAILRIEQAHPGKDWISFVRIHAQEITLQGTRRVLSPMEVISLLPRAAGQVASAGEREARITYERPGAVRLQAREAATQGTWALRNPHEMTDLHPSPMQELAAVRGDLEMETNVIAPADVVIVCAVPDLELDKVKRVIGTSWGELEPVPLDPQSYYHSIYKTAKGRQIRVVAAAPNHMGMSASAVLATKMIIRFRPKLVAMVGIAAGVKKKTERGFGDILAAEHTFDYGSGKVEMTGDESKRAVIFHPDPKPLDVDGRLLQRLRNWQSNKGHILDEIRRAWNPGPPDSSLKLHVGPLASGAAVVDAKPPIDEVVEHWRKLIGVEMEAYAVHRACKDTIEPQPKFLCLKSISDFAQDKEDAWRAYAAFTAAEFCYRFLVAEWEGLFPTA
ncbi:phosphorylase family protein [Sorangium sp. So ce124]|uniref:phosphorylase family protein n=1 Tax=Sorangium sp. So ce124 TaxID=3133280 RepID=UPI003F61ACD9